MLVTCKVHEVNLKEYLNDVIAKMPYMLKALYDELLQQLPHVGQIYQSFGHCETDK